MSNESIDIPIWRRGDAYPEEWPQWLRDADIEWCQVEVTKDGRVEWYDGVWGDGKWYDGKWHDGIWLGGFWHSGHWRTGVWCNGHWYGGTWCGGEWRAGTWCDGFWHDGETWRTDGPQGSGGVPA